MSDMDFPVTASETYRCRCCQRDLPVTREHWTWNKKYDCPWSNFCKDCQSEDRKQHSDRNKASVSRRRAKIAEVGGSHTASDIRQQFKSQKGLCWWCGEPLGDDQHVDHRVPISKGGSNAPENIVIAHQLCNLSKGAKMPWEFNGRLL